MNGTLARRDFLGWMAAATTAGLVGCNSTPEDSGRGSNRLTARPHAPTGTTTLNPGLIGLGLSGGRDAYLRVPLGYDPAHTWPLVLAFHGSGGTHADLMTALGTLADTSGFLMLGLDSYYLTWDVIADRYGVDVQLIDRALDAAFDRAAIDPTRIIVNGFSDGASYALGLGVSNGDLFTHVMAFSPGFMPPHDAAQGQPKFFVSHGLQDTVLPIDQASRPIVANLTRDGYNVTFVEFNGGHQLPAAVAQSAVDWALA